MVDADVQAQLLQASSPHWCEEPMMDRRMQVRDLAPNRSSTGSDAAPTHGPRARALLGRKSGGSMKTRYFC